MTVRRLEVTVGTLKEKIAAQSIDVDSARDAARRTAAERDAGLEAIAGLELELGGLQADLAKSEDEIARLAGLVAERDALLEKRKHEVAQLGVMFDEASFDASNRQIEIVAQEAKLEELAGAAAAAAGERDALQTELSARDEALRGEKRRTETLERNAARLTATLSDREEKLERRQRELDRARARLSETEGSLRETKERLAAGQEVAEAKKRAPAARGKPAPPPADMALLRERIDSLAAEMVSLTARLEGPDSGIAKLLAGADGENSLAGRIVALQKAAGRRQKA
jgi:chromosome segregation ATPase